jgi:hypothetical protein
MVIIKTELCIDKILRTFIGTGYVISKELVRETLLPAVVMLLACGLPSPSKASTSVPDATLAFFLGGAVMAAFVFMVLDFNAWRFQVLTSGIVFDGSMSAIFNLN